MPIKKENKDKYPKNWAQIRAHILARANNCCEFCGAENKSIAVYKDGVLEQHISPSAANYATNASIKQEAYSTADGKIIHKYRHSVVVLTIAHLDQNPENCNDDNLRALCQKCHNKLDGPYRALHRKISKLEDELEKYKSYSKEINNALYMDAYDASCSVDKTVLYDALKKDIERIRKKFSL